MTYTTIFWIIIAILICDYILGSVLSFLNRKNVSTTLPAIVADLYDKDKYKKQQEYFLENNRFSSINGAFSLIVSLSMYFLFGYRFVDSISANLVSGISSPLLSQILNSLIFFGIIGLFSVIIDIPFSIYGTFVIEEKYGFNKTTKKTFFTDIIKELLLGAILGSAIISILILIYNKLGAIYFAVLGWGILSAFSIFFSMFYSVLIVPLFNKQKPLPEGELRTAIESFCKNAGFSLKNVYVIDSSKRSTKANAYFSGLGKQKRIVLYDTLIESLSTEEIVAVLSHEIGHYQKKHTRSSIIVSLLNSSIIFALLAFTLNSSLFSEALGCENPSFHINLLVFSSLYTPFSTLLNVFMNVFSRKHEYEADNFAKEHGQAIPLASGLKKLSVSTLSNLNPHKAYVFFYYSHPTLIERLKNLQN